MAPLRAYLDVRRPLLSAINRRGAKPAGDALWVSCAALHAIGCCTDDMRALVRDSKACRCVDHTAGTPVAFSHP
jgi:hypothetical protein